MNIPGTQHSTQDTGRRGWDGVVATALGRSGNYSREKRKLLQGEVATTLGRSGNYSTIGKSDNYSRKLKMQWRSSTTQGRGGNYSGRW